MCGRFTLTIDINRVARVFGVAPSLQVPPRYNVAPTQDVVTIMRNGTAHLDLLRWGLIPAWTKDASRGSGVINASRGSGVINARAETLAEKPSFKRLLRTRRCLVVADGFYEWKQEHGGKTPMYITLKDQEPFAFAGLWDSWQDPEGQPLRTCTIITTEPNELMASIHNRMPVILPQQAIEQWLDPEQNDNQALLSLLKPYPADAMAARPVSRKVNNPKYDSAELIA